MKAVCVDKGREFEQTCTAWEIMVLSMSEAQPDRPELDKTTSSWRTFEVLSGGQWQQGQPFRDGDVAPFCSKPAWGN